MQPAWSTNTVAHTLCTYVRWFARPAGLRQPGPLMMQPQRLSHAYIAAFQDGEPLIAYECWAGTQGLSGPALVPAVQPCMLFMMSGILCLNALSCSVCGIGTLPCSVLLKTLCSCSCGSVTLWG